MIRRLAIYLRRNPLAGDTQEGVASWWLDVNAGSLQLLESVLGWFVAEGILDAVDGGDGRVHYRRAALTAAIDKRLDALIAEGWDEDET